MKIIKFSLVFSTLLIISCGESSKNNQTAASSTEAAVEDTVEVKNCSSEMTKDHNKVASVCKNEQTLTDEEVKECLKAHEEMMEKYPALNCKAKTVNAAEQDFEFTISGDVYKERIKAYKKVTEGGETNVDFEESSIAEVKDPYEHKNGKSCGEDFIAEYENLETACMPVFEEKASDEDVESCKAAIAPINEKASEVNCTFVDSEDKNAFLFQVGLDSINKVLNK